MRYLLLLAAVAALAAGYVVYYFQVENGVRLGFANWVASRRAEGFEVDFRSLETRGFPFRVVVALEAPRLAAPTALGAPAWRGQRLAGVVQPWNFGHLILELSGDGEIAFDEAGHRRRLAYSVEHGLASIEAGDGGLARLAVDLESITLTEAATAARFQTERAQLHLRPGDRADMLWQLVYKAERSRIEAEPNSPLGAALGALGPEVALAMFEASLNGRSPSTGASIAEIAAHWRNAGGNAELRRFKLVWGNLDIETSGTLSLDNEMRLIGALTARVRGHGKLIEALVAMGEMSAAEAKAAKVVLDLLAAAGGGVLSVPLVLQDGLVRLGPVALARLSPLLRSDGQSPAPPSPARRQ